MLYWEMCDISNKVAIHDGSARGKQGYQTKLVFNIYTEYKK